MSSNSDLSTRFSVGSAADSYKEMIEAERSLLHERAKSALSLGIPAEEKKFLKDAIVALSGLDQLVEIIDKNLNGVNRTVALSNLEKTIRAARVIGSHAIKNPVSGKLQTKGAASVQNSRSEHLDFLVEKHIKIELQKHPSLSANAIMNRILKPVNEELTKIPRPLTAVEKKMERKRMRQVATLVNRRDKGKLEVGEFDADIEKLKPLEPKEKEAKPDAIRRRVTKIFAKIRKKAA
jgi:hypothetical protein